MPFYMPVWFQPQLDSMWVILSQGGSRGCWMHWPVSLRVIELFHYTQCSWRKSHFSFLLSLTKLISRANANATTLRTLVCKWCQSLSICTGENAVSNTHLRNWFKQQVDRNSFLRRGDLIKYVILNVDEPRLLLVYSILHIVYIYNCLVSSLEL